MDKRSYIVQRRSRRECEELAASVRTALGLEADERVSMLGVIETILPQLIAEFHVRIVPDRMLAGAEAVTDLEKPIITFGESTYDRLYRGGRRERMTAAHELGHLLMHTQRQRWAAFGDVTDPTADPERQADIFAAAFLMPAEAFRRVKSIDEAMKKFGVSRDAAACRARKLGMKQLLQTKPNFFQRKKGRKPMARTP